MNRRIYLGLKMALLLLCLTFAYLHASPIQDALKEVRDPLKLSPTTYAEGQVLSFALAQNQAEVVIQQDRGWSYTRLLLSGRLQEMWHTPQGIFLYIEGGLRRPGLLERRSTEQERLETRLFARMRQRLDETIKLGANRLPDGSLAETWMVRVALDGKDYWIDLHLHPLRHRLLGYSLWAIHPLRNGQVLRTVLLSDYRRLADRDAPFVKREYYDGKLFIETRLKKVQLTRKLDPRALFEAAQKRRAYFGHLPVTLPLKKRNLLAMVQVQLIGEKGSITAQMLVDTGASTTILTSETARRLGLKESGEIGARPIGTELRLRSARLNALKLGKVLIPDRWVATGDLGLLGTLLQVDGILGSDVLSLFRTTLDFQRNQLILEAVPKVAQSLRVRQGGATLPLDNLLGNPALQVWLPNKRSSWLILDTGARFTVLPNALVTEEMRKQGGALSLAIGASGLPVTLKGVRLPEIFLYDLSKGVPVSSVSALFPADQETNILPETDFGVIGMNILRRYRITLDYNNGQITFKPNQYAGDRDADVGLVLNLVREPIEVQSIVPLSPAQEAGIQRGDRLLKINDRSTEGVSPTEVQKWLRGPEGSRVKLLLQRGEERLEVELKRETLIL